MVRNARAAAIDAPSGPRPYAMAAAPRSFPSAKAGNRPAAAGSEALSPANRQEPEHAPARGAGPTLEQVWAWLAEVMDPEIPVLSVVDLGIVRDLHWQETAAGRELVLTWTPTYSGCPAAEVINADMKAALAAHGIDTVRLKLQLSPAWTTDWLTDAGRRKLKAYGIAPPACGSCVAREIVAGMARREPAVECPRCGSRHTRCLSLSGSTRCKALYACDDCLEPFDYFKVH